MITIDEYVTQLAAEIGCTEKQVRQLIQSHHKFFQGPMTPFKIQTLRGLIVIERPRIGDEDERKDSQI